MNTRLWAITLPLVLCCAPVHADDYIPGAALVDPALPGATQYDGWIGLTTANYPGYGGFPGLAPWPAPIGSNRTAANTFNRDEPCDATLLKVADGTGGGPFPAGASLYFGGFSDEPNNDGGTLEVSDPTPVAGLRNVVLQVQIAEAWTYDFLDDELPTLSFNGGDQRLPPTGDLLIEQFYLGTVMMPTGPEDLFINTILVQWDLSAIPQPITSFAARFTGVQHSQVYGLRVDQSDVFTPYGACPADLTADGVVDFSDYLEFLNLYDALDPAVDFNGDGVVDFSDYLEFLNHYDAGC